jgi:hypothetical protein
MAINWVNYSNQNPCGGSTHIQPKTSVKDFDLALFQWKPIA